MPDGTNPIVLRHAVNTDGDQAAPIGELFIGVDGGDRHRCRTGVLRPGRAVRRHRGRRPTTRSSGDGCRSRFGTMLSYFTEAELAIWNDANWIDPRLRGAIPGAEGRTRPGSAGGDRPRDADGAPRRRRLHPDVARTRPSGIPDGHVRGLGPAAG